MMKDDRLYVAVWFEGGAGHVVPVKRGVESAIPGISDRILSRDHVLPDAATLGPSASTDPRDVGQAVLRARDGRYSTRTSQGKLHLHVCSTFAEAAGKLRAHV